MPARLTRKQFMTLLASAVVGGSSASSTIAATTVPRVPAYDHIILVMMENKDYKHIIGNLVEAPYINELAAQGALLTDYLAVAHPSLPNYYALYAGTTYGILDDDDYVLHGPTLATILHKAGKTFAGYVEHPTSTDSHNPWSSYPESDDVERDFVTFPAGNFAELPHVSFVIPNVDHDMHDGTIAEGDAWLKTNLDAYAQWAKSNNSLLIVLWDETDEGSPNHVPAIFYGAHVKTGRNAKSVNNYNILATMLAAHELVGPENAANAAVIDVFGLRGPPFARPRQPVVRGPLTPKAPRAKVS